MTLRTVVGRARFSTLHLCELASHLLYKVRWCVLVYSLRL